MLRIRQHLRGVILAMCLFVAFRHACAAPWVTAHYVYWEENVLSPAQIDMSPITDLIYFAAVPTLDGTLDASSLDEPAAVATAAHTAGKRALVCVGGGGASIYAGFSASITKTYRATFVKSIVNWVRTNGYDGVDVDMEPVNDSDAANFRDFVRALSAALKAYRKTAVLTVDIAVGEAPPPGAFVPVADCFNQINLETYDLSGAYEGWVTWYDSCLYTNNQTFPPSSGGAPLPSSDEYINQWIAAGIPAAKLGVGIACQGADWTGATGPQQGISGVTVNYRDYNDIMTNSYSANAYHYDIGARAPYLSLANDFISYTDPALCTDKVAYVKNRRLGGLMVWDIEAQAMPNGDQPLLAALATGLGNTPQAGRYTVLLTPAQSGPTIPQGTGYAMLTTSATGGVTMVGKLPDGEGISASGVLAGSAAGNQFLIYETLNYPSVTTKGAKGLLVGSVTFEKLSGSDFDGTLEWMKPQQTKGDYPAAIDTNVAAIGSLYAVAKKGSVLPGFTSGTLELSDTGALITPMDKTMTLTSANTLTVTNPGPDKTKITIHPSTGLFSGSFVYPNQTGRTDFDGVLFQDQTIGSGFFLGPGGSGNVSLSP